MLSKLARCLVEVVLDETLSKELALNSKYRIFFRYVQILNFFEDIQTQDDLSRLPDLFPHLVELKQEYRYDIHAAIRNPSAYPDDFGEGTLNFRFWTKFKALERLKCENWKVSPSELKEIVKSCRVLEEVHIFSAKLKELENGQIRTTFASCGILLSENKFTTGSYEWEYSVGDGKTIRKQRISLENFHSSKAMVNCLDQRGYLRKEIDLVD